MQKSPKSRSTEEQKSTEEYRVQRSTEEQKSTEEYRVQRITDFTT